MREKNPRYSNLTDILEILYMMQARPQGVCIKDVEECLPTSRSTAERLLDAIKNSSLPVFEIDNSSTRKKYWGFSNAFMKEIINFTPEEIANLVKIKDEQSKKGFRDKEKLLEQMLEKIKAFSRRNITKIDNSIEILMQTEGFAVRQMPKFNIDLNFLSTIREAMKMNRKITAEYNGKPRLLSPYGLIYGEKIYLIAVESKKGTTPYCYLLHKLSDVQITNETFDKGDFNLDEYSKKSFGIYQGEINDVKLLFSENVAEDVLNYNFHSTQKVKRNDDGTVMVKFKASGEYEIMWHLFKWGADVKILAPASLKKQYIELLKTTMEHQKAKE